MGPHTPCTAHALHCSTDSPIDCNQHCQSGAATTKLAQQLQPQTTDAVEAACNSIIQRARCPSDKRCTARQGPCNFPVKRGGTAECRCSTLPAAIAGRRALVDSPCQTSQQQHSRQPTASGTRAHKSARHAVHSRSRCDSVWHAGQQARIMPLPTAQPQRQLFRLEWRSSLRSQAQCSLCFGMHTLCPKTPKLKAWFDPQHTRHTSKPPCCRSKPHSRRPTTPAKQQPAQPASVLLPWNAKCQAERCCWGLGSKPSKQPKTPLHNPTSRTLALTRHASAHHDKAIG